MDTHSALERAIIAEIRYLSGELERIRRDRAASAAPTTAPAGLDLVTAADYMADAMQDPGFRNWMLRRRLEVQ